MKHFFSLFILFIATLVFPTHAKAYLINEWAEIATITPDEFDIKSDVPTKIWRDSFSGMEFVHVKGGCFKMGSPPRADGRDSDEQPVHNVCLSDFWVGQKEVTQAQWRTVMRSNPSKFRKGDNHPVERVSHPDAIRLVNRLNEQHKGKAVFSLPTEAQWEYVCREGGLRSIYPGREGINKIAWQRENSGDSTQVTGTKLPNLLGVHDLGGNVWEWVQDTYEWYGYSKHKTNNPVFKGKGLYRGIRGGSWNDGSNALRCTNRGFTKFSDKREDVGVRLVVFVKQPPKEERREEESSIDVLPF
ncbi:MAG: formylglycine-generating enzyme family protein [Magnetococcales bacterium]|nr:formylglycine-generating enzyme family protein [Magnetococcales bacterium]